MDEANPESTDSSVEVLFEDKAPEGNEDAQGKGEGTLSLDELNTLAGRKDNPFKTKEEFVKHYGNLKSFVGKRTEPKPDTSTKEELAQLKKEIAKEKEVNTLLSEAPTAKEHLDIIEAYAEKNGITLIEAWKSDKFKLFAESSQRKKILTTNNRISPLQSKNIQELSEQAKNGSEKAKNELVSEWFGKK